jgi:terminase small subunit / prophage DNA-packing protein
MAETISERDLAAVFGIDPRSGRDLAARGIIARVGRGRYDQAAATLAYCAHLREIAAGRGSEDGEFDLTAERARLAKEQADAAALKNAVMRGELLPADIVEQTWSTVFREWRSGLLAVPSRLRQALALSAEQTAVVDREIRNLLTAFAEACGAKEN